MEDGGHARAHLDPTLRARLTAEFRERWARAGYPSLVHHILGNMSEAHGVPIGVLKDITRPVRDERAREQRARPSAASRPTSRGAAPLAILDGSNLAWARTDQEGHPRLDNLALARAALAERGYQSLIVVDAALRHQLVGRDGAELERQVQAQEVIQAPAATDGDEWILRIADHHGAPVVSNDRFDEYVATFPWIEDRRVAVVFLEHSALLQGPALDGSGRPPASPAALREEIEELRQAAAHAQVRAEDLAAVRGRLARLEARLAREQARSAQLQAEVARLEEALDQERRVGDALRQEIRQFPEQLTGLSHSLAEAQEDAASARGQRDALQAQVRDFQRQVQQLAARRPEERSAATTRADLDALRTELRGEIRDVARVLKDTHSVLPRILAITREVRETVSSIQKAQGEAGTQLERLEQASQVLVATTDYLAALSEDEAGAEHQADNDVGLEAGDAGAEHQAEPPAELGPDLGTAPTAAEDGRDHQDDSWESEFEHIEEAWLAGRRVGDPHEAINFLHLVTDLRLDDRDPVEVVAAFDRFRARAGGERFSYCPLHGAVHLVRRRASLDNPLVLVRYRELLRMPPCPDVASCPGATWMLDALERGESSST